MATISATFLLEARSLAQAGQLDAAIALLEAGITVYPEYPTAYLLLARYLRQQNRLDAAAEVLLSAQERFPRDTKLQQLYHDILIERLAHHSQEEEAQSLLPEQIKAPEEPSEHSQATETPQSTEEPEIPHSSTLSSTPLSTEDSSSHSTPSLLPEEPPTESPREPATNEREFEPPITDSPLSPSYQSETLELSSETQSLPSSDTPSTPSISSTAPLSPPSFEEESPTPVSDIEEHPVAPSPPQPRTIDISPSNRPDHSEPNSPQTSISFPLEGEGAAAPLIEILSPVAQSEDESIPREFHPRFVRLIPGLEFTSLGIADSDPQTPQLHSRLAGLPSLPEFPLSIPPSDIANPAPTPASADHNAATTVTTTDQEIASMLSPLEQLANKLHKLQQETATQESETRETSSATSSSKTPPPIISPTMAQLLEQQGKIEAALQVYHQLLHQDPDKAEEYQRKIVELKQKQQYKA